MEGGNDLTTWLTTKEVAEIYEVTERTIQRRISNSNFDGITKVTSDNRNQMIYLIDLQSLSPEIQKNYYIKNAKEYEQFSNVVSKKVSKDVSGDTYTLGELKELHGDKFEKHLEDALRKKEAVRKFLRLEHGQKKDGVAEICKEYGFKKRSLYNYVDIFESQGFVALIRKPRKNKGKSTKLNREAIKYIRGCYLQPLRPKVQHVYDLYIKKAKEMGWNEVSYDTVDREIKRIPEREVCFAREGEKEYNAKFAPTITRTYDDLLINEYWVGDGHTLAIWTPEDGRVSRYTLSAWMDMRSRAIVGWSIAKNSNSQVIASALRSGIMRHGLPGTCYMDNGLDYKSGFLNASDKEEFFDGYVGVFTSLGIDTSFAIPYNAKAKPIERFFRTFSDKLSRYIPGFCGESIEERPHDIDKKEILIKGLDIHTVSKVIEGYFEKYNNEEHSSLKGKTPMEVIESVDMFRNDIATDEELDMLMLRADVRSIKSSGIMKFNTWYWNDKLIPHIGESCVVRYDPNKVGELYVYIDGILTCKAESKELLSMNASEEDMKRWGKLKAEAKKATRESINAYEVRQDEVRKAMLEDYVDEETLSTIITATTISKVDKGKVVRINKNVAKAKEKNELDKEIDNNKGFEFFEKLGEEMINAK